MSNKEWCVNHDRGRCVFSGSDTPSLAVSDIRVDKIVEPNIITDPNMIRNYLEMTNMLGGWFYLNDWLLITYLRKKQSF